MATISETGVIVFALLISMPEIDHRSAKWAAAFRQHKARKFEPTASSARLAQVTALRRSWLEKRPSVWRSVGSSPSRQEGVGASSCVRTASTLDSSHPAASMPALSRNRRRVGFDSLFINTAKLLIYEPRPAVPDPKTLLLL